MKITIEESAMESLKTMAQQLQMKHDALLEALKISQELLKKVDPYKGQSDLLLMTVAMNDEIIAKCTAKPEVLE